MKTSRASFDFLRLKYSLFSNDHVPMVGLDTINASSGIVGLFVFALSLEVFGSPHHPSSFSLSLPLSLSPSLSLSLRFPIQLRP